MTERAAPFYCPYCGDENLRMFGEKHGEWRCGACQRVFRLGYIGLAADWTRPVEVLDPAGHGSDMDPAGHGSDLEATTL